MLSSFQLPSGSFLHLFVVLGVLCLSSCARYCDQECEKEPLHVRLTGFTATEIDTVILEEYDQGTTNLARSRIMQGADFYDLWVVEKDYRFYIPATGDEFVIQDLQYIGPVTERYKCYDPQEQHHDQFYCLQDIACTVNGVSQTAQWLPLHKK